MLSGTRIILKGHIVCKLCEGKKRDKRSLKMNYSEGTHCMQVM